MSPEAVGSTIEDWERVLGPLLDSRRTSELLGGSPEDLEPRPLGLADAAGQLWYPAYQFEAGKLLEPVVHAVRTVAARTLSPWTAAAWAVAPDTALEGLSPVDWVKKGGDPARLARIARHDAARLAH